MMTKTVLCCVILIALVMAAAPVGAVEPAASRGAAHINPANCEDRIDELETSNAEGEERLVAKRAVIDACFNEFRRDKTIMSLVAQCAKYGEQPVVKQQFVAECQLAAFRYGNALRALKAQYRK